MENNTITNNSQTFQINNLTDLFFAITDGNIPENAFSTLPTFGGNEPSNTSGIFSWDENQLLIQNEFGWAIINRAEREV